MSDAVPPRQDFEFYSQPRFPGTPESVITAFSLTLRNLIHRTISDLRSGRRGPFASPTEALFSEPLAMSLERVNIHVDAFESISLRSELPAESATRFRTVLANVLRDSGFTETAGAHNDAPPAEESKFDEHKGGELIEILGDIGEKLEALASVFEAESAIIKLIALILKDLGFPGKLTETIATNKIAQQAEDKLREVIDHVRTLPDDLARIKVVSGESNAEVKKIELKADALGSLLGHTLVGERWVVDPSQAGFTSNRLPPKDIKAELHDIEARLKENCDIIENPPEDGNGNGGDGGYDKPSLQLRPVLRDRRLKKIFVYAENTFAARTSTERRRIRLHTPAFDVSGWLDLTHLRPGDVIEVDVRVSFANRRDVLFARTAFNKGRLVPFADLARGQNYLSGSNLLIALRQKASADNFATPVELAYQFVVESA